MLAQPKFPYSGIQFAYAAGPFRGLFESDLGQAIWSILTQPHIVHGMVVAVRLGAAPVSAIAQDLLAEFGHFDPTLSPRDQLARGLAERFHLGQEVSFDQLKRMIGHMIRQILAAMGCRIRTKNSPANDRSGIFSTSARYDFSELPSSEVER